MLGALSAGCAQDWTHARYVSRARPEEHRTPATMTSDAQTSWKGKVLLACLATIAALGLVEGTARLLFSPPGDVVPRQLGRFDPTLGWSMKPSSHAVSRRTGYEIDYRINSKGLRDDETSYEKPAGTFRDRTARRSRTFGSCSGAKHLRVCSRATSRSRSDQHGVGASRRSGVAVPPGRGLSLPADLVMAYGGPLREPVTCTASLGEAEAPGSY